MRHILRWAIGFGLSACASSQPGSANPPSAAQDATIAPPTASVDAAASDGKCHGKANPELVQSLQARAGATRPCYERELRTTPRLSGRIVLAVFITEDGDVQSVEVQEDGTESEPLRSCVAGIFRRAHFPPPTGGCVSAHIPLSFVANPAPDAGAD